MTANLLLFDVTHPSRKRHLRSRPWNLLSLLGLIGIVSIATAQTPTPTASMATAGTLRTCADSLRATGTGSGNYRCFESENGWFLTDDTVWAQRAIPAIRTAAALFEKTFGKPVGRGLIVHHESKVTMDEAPFKAAGARWTWSWMERTKEYNDENSTNTHEIGHKWYESLPWKPDQHEHGADWVAEAAAILMEDSLDTAQRRAFLFASYRAGVSEAKDLIRPLDTLFTMQNPGTALLQGLLATMQTPENAVPQGVAQNAAQMIAFYAQVRGVIDFLLERTGDSAILGDITANESNGSNVTAWLAANGARYKLPTTVADLEKEWQHWLAQRAQTP